MTTVQLESNNFLRSIDVTAGFIFQAVRLKNNLSQHDFINELGLKKLNLSRGVSIGQGTLSKMERGQLAIPLAQWFLFCQTFSIDPDSLLSGYLDKLSYFNKNMESGLNFYSSSTQKRYRKDRVIKVRDLLPLINVAVKNSSAKALIEWVVKEMKVKPSILIDLDEQINLDFVEDIISFLDYQKYNFALLKKDIENEMKLRNSFGKFGDDLSSKRSLNSALKKYVNFKNKSQNLFNYELENSSSIVRINVRPNEKILSAYSDINPRTLNYLDMVSVKSIPAIQGIADLVGSYKFKGEFSLKCQDLVCQITPKNVG